MDDSRVVPLTLLGQAGVTLCLAAGLWLWQGQVAGVSALLGGATAVIPNGFLAARLLQWRAGASADSLLRSVWIGEIGKLLLTAVLFAAIFGAVRPLAPPAVFGGFIAAQMAIFGAAWLGGARRTEAITKS
ncbi:MAG TPA: ATP synthase subunit I [Gammaproteobacteria bacterium]|nr:ATP synthase subunit I [Gammaproteobacteria bacterium]